MRLFCFRIAGGPYGAIVAGHGISVAFSTAALATLCGIGGFGTAAGGSLHLKSLLHIGHFAAARCRGCRAVRHGPMPPLLPKSPAPPKSLSVFPGHHALQA